nr:hypothetical protein [Thiocapsa sp. KS1]
MSRRRVDKRSAVHQHRREVRWTSLSLVQPTAGIMNNAVERSATPVLRNAALPGFGPMHLARAGWLSLLRYPP